MSMNSPDTTCFENAIDDAGAKALLALDAGRIGRWSWHIPVDEVVGDHHFAQFFGLDLADQPWASATIFEAILADDRGHTQDALNHALESTGEYEAEFRVTVSETRWLGGRGRVSERDENGNPVRLVGVNWDISDLKLNEERMAVLAAEMDHRVKNAFAVIRALVNLGLRTASDKQSFGETLKAQVEAMATAHVVSAGHARQTGKADTQINLKSILDTALAPWAGVHDIECVVEAAVDVSPREVSAISMMVYELVTNATKYSVLGMQKGTLRVSASVAPDGTRHIEWVERVDVPIALPDGNEKPGFGSTLMDHCAKTLRAETTRDLTPQGLRFSILIPKA